MVIPPLSARIFVRSTPMGGGYAIQTSEQISRAYERREEAAMSLE
jgi:hypothetical protein